MRPAGRGAYQTGDHKRGEKPADPRHNADSPFTAYTIVIPEYRTRCLTLTRFRILVLLEYHLDANLHSCLHSIVRRDHKSEPARRLARFAVDRPWEPAHQRSLSRISKEKLKMKGPSPRDSRRRQVRLY